MTQYREMRLLGLSRRTAVYSLCPARLRVAIHALRGRPVIYGVSFRGSTHLAFTPGTRHLLIVDCRSIDEVTDQAA